MGLEQGSGVSLEPQPGIEQKKIERAKQNIKASLSVSAFSSEKEEEYEKSIRSVYQLQQWHFEQEELKKQKTANALDSQIKGLDEQIKGLEERISTLNNCL